MLYVVNYYRKPKVNDSLTKYSYHSGQGEVGKDGQQDDNTGRDEVPKGTVIEGRASCNQIERTPIITHVSFMPEEQF